MKTKLFVPYRLFCHFSLFFLAASFLLHTQSVQSQTASKYNVLFIAVDDMNDRCSFLGQPEVKTPNLKRLLAHGMLFTHAYCQYALCNPSRTSLLSGWRPDKTGIFENHIRPRSVIGPDVKFLPEYFSQYGYHTERYGKIMHGLFEDDITWDYAEPSASSSNVESGNTGGNNCKRPYGSTSGPDWWIDNISDQKINNLRASRLVSRMQQPLGQPFFYALGLSVHHPFTPSLKYWNKNGDFSVQELLPIDATETLSNLKGNGSGHIIIPATPAGDRNDIPCSALTGQEILGGLDLKRAIHAYDAEVAQMDAQLGLVLDEMDRQNLWTNTVVVFWSDHGQHLGEHEGLWGKQTLFEESLHIPLIVCVPGKPAGQCSRLVELVDLYPTLAELCKLPPPPNMEGTSFARLLDVPTLTWKKAAFSEVKRHNNITGRSARTLQYRYTSWQTEGEELYDHNTDPHEYTNLVKNPKYATVLTQMRTILTQGWKSSVPPSIIEKAITPITSNLSGSTIELAASAIPFNKLSLYPNPSTGDLTITYNCDNAGKIQLRIYDIHRRIVFNKMEIAVKGMNTFQLKLFNLIPGTYFFQLNNSDSQNPIKFLIAK